MSEAQSRAMLKLWADPDFAARRAAKNAEVSRRPEVRRGSAERMQLRWADPECAREMAKSIAAARERRAGNAGRAEKNRESWRVPEIRAARVAGMRRAKKDVAVVERHRCGVIAAWMRPARREKHIETIRARTSGFGAHIAFLPELQTALADMLGRGFSQLRCAEELGVCEAVCRRWIRELRAGAAGATK